MNFSPSTNRFRLSGNGGSFNFRFSALPDGSGPSFFADHALRLWFLDTCSFIQRGTNFAPFHAYNIPTDGTPWVFPPSNTETLGTVISLGIGTVTVGIQSGVAGMVYTRFVTLSSQALNRYAYGESRVSRSGDGGGRGKIIAILDTSLFQINGSAFEGSILPAQQPGAPIININNPQGQLEQYLDFIVRDEYGDALDELFVNPLDRIGITFWLRVTF